MEVVHAARLSARPIPLSEVIPQSLHTRLADVELRADRANRRHAILCQLIGDYLGRLLPNKRIPIFPLSGMLSRPARELPMTIMSNS